MNIYQAAVLGVLQGLTEFIPISSTAHLVIVPALLGWGNPGVAFDVFVHFGTLLALVIFFWGELVGIVGAWLVSLADLWRGRSFSVILGEDPFKRLAWLIIIGSVPAVVIGGLFKATLERLFENVLGTSCFLLVTGGLLWAAERENSGRRQVGEMSVLDSLFIGLAQAVAIAPGISRSGATISAGLFLGLERDFAARYAFLLSIPAILGATVVKFNDFLRVGASGGYLSIVIGTVLAIISGYVTIKVVLRVVQRGKLTIFAYYCWAVGLVVILVRLLGR